VKKFHVVFALLFVAIFLLAAAPVHAASGDIHISFQEERTDWVETVCTLMTEGGCRYFREYEAATAWTLMNQTGTLGVSVHFVERVIALDGGLELWRLEVMPMPDAETVEVYAIVEPLSRLIDRVVMVNGRLVAGGQ